MHESLFNNRITLSTPTGLTPTKVDIVKTISGIEIRLIETSDIFSLWTCSLTSADFGILKRNLDIIVDFDRFIQIIVNYFHGVTTSKYIACFNNGTLKFMGNIEFRNICELELKFIKPEESQFKMYLGDLVGRMEGDNIKLIKENSILRDRCMNGDHTLKEKIRYLDHENIELRRRLELIQKDLSDIQNRAISKEDEVAKLSNRIYELDGENTRLRYEIEKYQRENTVSFKDQLRNKEEEMNNINRELNTANEIIKKIRQENLDLKQFKADNIGALQKESDRCEELTLKLEEINKKMSQTESKYKKLKDEIKDKTQKIEELSESNRILTKRLENAQNVYNHFYSKKVEDHTDNFSDNFSLRPESPPAR